MSTKLSKCTDGCFLSKDGFISIVIINEYIESFGFYIIIRERFNFPQNSATCNCSFYIFLFKKLIPLIIKQVIMLNCCTLMFNYYWVGCGVGLMSSCVRRRFSGWKKKTANFSFLKWFCILFICHEAVVFTSQEMFHCKTAPSFAMPEVRKLELLVVKWESGTRGYKACLISFLRTFLKE